MSYRELKSYQQATIIYDLTVEFCEIFVDQARKFHKTDTTYKSDKSYGSDRSDTSDMSYKSNTSDATHKTYPSYKIKSRMSDQMVQAARSGKQNIVEGTAVSKTWPQTEVKLLGVARGSFEELLHDYEDFLRQRDLKQWGKDDPRALEIRNLHRSNKSDKSYATYSSDGSYKTDMSNKTDGSYSSYSTYLSDPERAANCLITLINQTNFLIDQQIAAVKYQHEEKGITFESREQKLRRLLREKQNRESAEDGLVAEYLAKNKNEKN